MSVLKATSSYLCAWKTVATSVKVDTNYSTLPASPLAAPRRKGEATAFYTYYRQRLAITNIRGVAKTILQRIPFCTGLHFPITPHHFNTVHMGPIPTPTQPTHPIDTPNDEHNDNNDGEEETTPTGDLDTTA